MSREEDLSVEVWSESAAKSIVRRIEKDVDKMISETEFVGPNWKERNNVFGFFDADEVNLGPLLGSGGFSDVYQLEGFSLNNSSKSKAAVTKYNPMQSAARQYYEDNTDRDGSATYAVKILRPRNMKDPNRFCLAAGDLIVESLLLSSLNHPNVIDIRGWTFGGTESYLSGTHDGFLIIMDRLESTLEQKIQNWRKKHLESMRPLFTQKRRQLIRRTRIAYQVGSALEYLHSRRIAFRDLKPDNIGFDEEGNAKLFDFGLSRELPNPKAYTDETFSMTATVGTVRYMSPECLLGRDYNCKTDVYSWAMVFWEMLSLEKPYRIHRQGSHRNQVCLEGERPFLHPAWGSAIHRILEGSWHHNVDYRMTMVEVILALKGLARELDFEVPHLEARPRRRSTFRPSLIVNKDDEDQVTHDSHHHYVGRKSGRNGLLLDKEDGGNIMGRTTVISNKKNDIDSAKQSISNDNNITNRNHSSMNSINNHRSVTNRNHSSMSNINNHRSVTNRNHSSMDNINSPSSIPTNNDRAESRGQHRKVRRSKSPPPLSSSFRLPAILLKSKRMLATKAA